MYTDWEPLFENLTDAQVADIIRGLFAHENDKEYVFRDDTKAIAALLVSTLERNSKKYEKTCEKNRENIKKRYTNVYERSNSYTSVNECIQKNTNATDNDNENDNENDNDNENVNDSDNDNGRNCPKSSNPFIDLINDLEDIGE